MIPGLSLRSNPGLKLANAFGVFVEFKNASWPNPERVDTGEIATEGTLSGLVNVF
jgi:hypothetical protein